MRNKIASLFVSCLLSLIAFAGYSQTNNKVEMADTMRSEGKIYVVIAVILTILAGLFLYVARIDRKLTKLEKES
ncbi:CcmD family protein [Pollutibacter soli]|uniref:CcmD family protein n=1 Tax=Pollutibacter soli TaxID=3034157 RepID=UPI0030135032